jgi:hypothetical protein
MTNMNGKWLSVETRSEIAALYHTNTFSIQDLTVRYKVSKYTAHDIVKKKRLCNTVADGTRSGRPKMSTETDDRDYTVWPSPIGIWHQNNSSQVAQYLPLVKL